MQTGIRKTVQHREHLETQAAKELRRSKRCRVPNNIYSYGIEELLREAHSKESQQQTREVSDCRTEQDHSELGFSTANTREERHGWMKCILPGTEPRNMEVRVVLATPQRRKRTSQGLMQETACKDRSKIYSSNSQEEKEMTWYELDKPRKKFKPDTTKKQSLLEILYSIAKKVAEEPMYTDSRDGKCGQFEEEEKDNSTDAGFCHDKLDMSGDRDSQMPSRKESLQMGLQGFYV